jgi:hypothetical protein
MSETGQEIHTVVLRRVGWVLMALCAIDVLVFVMSLVWKPGHIVLPVRALVLFGAASLLLQNSLGAAVFVRWMAVFLAVMALGGVLHVWVLLPWDLLRAQWTFNSHEMRANLYETLLNAVVCLWLARELSHPSLMEVLLRHRKRSLDLCIAAGAGGAMLFVVMAVVSVFMSPSDKAKAEELAQAQLPKGYQVHMARISHRHGPYGASASAMVWAWTERDLKRVQVQWAKTD